MGEEISGAGGWKRQRCLEGKLRHWRLEAPVDLKGDKFVG